MPTGRWPAGLLQMADEVALRLAGDLAIGLAPAPSPRAYRQWSCGNRHGVRLRQEVFPSGPGPSASRQHYTTRPSPDAEEERRLDS